MHIEKFHSFCKLVRKTFEAQQESYSKGNAENKLVAQAKALEKKLSDQFKQFENAPVFYEWQKQFIRNVRLMRAEQVMYYQKRYDTIKLRCKQLEEIVKQSIDYIEKYHPTVFHEEKTKQEELFN